MRDVLAQIIAGDGDDLPVSAMPIDGTFPTAPRSGRSATSPSKFRCGTRTLCIQCGKCVLVCPHAVIRAKVYDASYLGNAPAGFKAVPARWKDMKDRKYTLQVAPEDCTGCALCVEVCPAKSKSEVKHRAINMAPQPPLRETEAANWDFFLSLPETDRKLLSPTQVKDIQLLQPLFEFSGACSGCGETPYLKLMTQLFGDRALIANATGCSSIYGGNLPTTPYCTNAEGRGPAWSNSLFEDNAEFGLGMRLAVDKQNEYARELVWRLGFQIGDELAQAILNADQTTEAGHLRPARARRRTQGEARRHRHPGSAATCSASPTPWSRRASGSSAATAGPTTSATAASITCSPPAATSTSWCSIPRSTPTPAARCRNPRRAARWPSSPPAASPRGKKDLALMAMSYGSVYVAKIAMGANDMQTVKAFLEAEAYDGPSLIIAYSHCIAHGYDLAHGMDQQKAAVNSGHWPLFRYNPDLVAQGKNPFQLDSRPPTIALKDYIYNETRYTMLAKSNPEEAKKLYKLAQEDVAAKWKLYEHMSHQTGAAVEEVKK